MDTWLISQKEKIMSKLEHEELEAEEMRIRIDEGTYEAICSKSEYGICWGGQKKLYLTFCIINHDKYEGAELFLACTKPTKKLSYRFKLHKQWSLALGRVPKKKERFNKDLFLDKLYLIKVGDTKIKGEDGKLLPDFLQYSVVKSIIKPLTGEGSL